VSISIVLNSPQNCTKDADCPTEDTYLATAIVYINNLTSYANLPKIQVIRNAGWFKPYTLVRAYKQKFRATIRQDRVTDFFALQSDQNSNLADFKNKVVNYFHAAAEEEEESWAHKDIFGGAFSKLDSCQSENNTCSLKAYLIKFSETASGIPTNALRISTALGRADGIQLRTFSPIESDIYNNQMTIRFVWPDNRYLLLRRLLKHPQPQPLRQRQILQGLVL